MECNDKYLESLRNTHFHYIVYVNYRYRYFFVFGQILHGIGAAPLITLGTALLDESVSRIKAPLFIGIMQVRMHDLHFFQFTTTDSTKINRPGHSIRNLG